MSTPLRIPRLIVLFLTWAFAVISGSVGLNALIKSNAQKDYVKSKAPTGVVVDINTDDQLHSGIVLTVFSTLLGIATFHFIAQEVIRARWFPAFSLRIQSAVVGFLTFVVLVVLIPVDIIARTRQARVTAKLGSLVLPQSVINQQQAALGVSPVYWDQDYIRMLAIIPWGIVLFGAIATGLLFSAERNTPSSNASQEQVFARDADKHTVDPEEKVMDERLA